MKSVEQPFKAVRTVVDVIMTEARGMKETHIISNMLIKMQNCAMVLDRLMPR